MDWTAHLLADGPNELALSIAWHAGLTRRVTTGDGTELDVVFPGHWSHGLGPDFRDAMLARSDGRLLTGDVELHLRAGDWARHGHHLDPAYDRVVLHVVTSAEGFETRRSDGGIVPVAELHVSAEQLQDVHERNPTIWAQLGGEVCAPRLAVEAPGRLRDALLRLGDRRLLERVAVFEGALATATPLDALLPALFDAFGYSRNREQMRAVHAHLPWGEVLTAFDTLARERARLRLLALLLGTGGWLPMPPSHARLARLNPTEVDAVEREWSRTGMGNSGLGIISWDMSRSRPANHPVTRISALASLLAAHGSRLVADLLAVLREGSSLVALLRTSVGTNPPLGADRATAIAASVVIPFAMALAHAADDAALEDAAQEAWSSLPAGAMPQGARRALSQVTGDVPLHGLKERGVQGLLVLDRTLCGPRRCYECPIAHAVIHHERTSPPIG